MIILIIFLVIAIPFAVFSANYVPPQEDVRLSLGDYEIVEHCSYEIFQDYTDYGKYTYENPNIENNKYLKQMTEEDIEELNSYLDNYDEWVAVFSDEISETNKQFVETYDFDRSIISITDYCYIYSNPDYPEFSSYDLYFYDTETEILYYFHNNI